MNFRWQTHICPQCGEKFQSSRREAKYCSPKCRKKVNLTKKRIDDLGRQVLATIRVLADYCEQEAFSEQSAEILGQIRRVLNFTDNRSGSSQAAGFFTAGDPDLGGDEPSLSLPAPLSVHIAAGTDTKLGDRNNLQQVSVNWLQSQIDTLRKRIEAVENQVDWRPEHER